MSSLEGGEAGAQKEKIIICVRTYVFVYTSPVNNLSMHLKRAHVMSAGHERTLEKHQSTWSNRNPENKGAIAFRVIFNLKVKRAATMMAFLRHLYSNLSLCVITLSFFRFVSSEESFFEFSSGAKEYDEAYKLAMTEVERNIENGVFIAGAGWTQLWTRDTSYAVELGAGLLNPEMSKQSLQKSIQRDQEFGEVWLQDQCGHFGGWPNLSDAIVGVRGAWSIYLTTGDTEWLAWAYTITKSSLARAERDVFDSSSGLFLGCSSFMESNSGYPEKYRGNGKLVGKTKALSTNLLHYAGYKLGAEMAKQLGTPQAEVQQLEDKGKALRDKIRSRLWSSENGYYSYVEDENDKLLQQMEGLGESLALLDDFETDPQRINSIFASTHRTRRGLPCLWPQFKLTIEGIFDYYHNGRIWPFVQGYWGLAAARHQQLDVFAEELANMVWLSQQGNTFAEFYELDGKFPEERARQLWSDTGFLSMIFHGLFGMNFQPNGIKFAPLKPASVFAETISLEGVKYRGMVLNINVSGSGVEIASFEVDGSARLLLTLLMKYRPFLLWIAKIKSHGPRLSRLPGSYSWGWRYEVPCCVAFAGKNLTATTATIKSRPSSFF